MRRLADRAILESYARSGRQVHGRGDRRRPHGCYGRGWGRGGCRIGRDRGRHGPTCTIVYQHLSSQFVCALAYSFAGFHPSYTSVQRQVKAPYQIMAWEMDTDSLFLGFFLKITNTSLSTIEQNVT